MDRDTPSRTHLPAGLLGTASDHLLGLVRVRLSRVRGKAGAYPIASWTMTTEDGEQPTHEQLPGEDAETIAEEIYRAAVSDLAEGENNDKRCSVEFIQVLEDKTTSSTDFGFKLDPDAEQLGHRTVDSARAGFIAEQSLYVHEMHKQNLALSRENANMVRVVSGLLKPLVQIKFDAMDDRVEAMLDRAGIERKDETPADPQWVKETGATAREFIRKFAPGMADAMGWDGETADVPEDSLRGALRTFGASLRKEQQAKMVGLIGMGPAAKLKSAGTAPTDEDAIEPLQAVLDGAATKLDAVHEMLSDDQRKLFELIFERLDAIVSAAESKSA